MEEVRELDASDEDFTDDDEKEKREAAEKALDELKAKAREKFSEEEIVKFIEMGKVLCQKTVLSALVCVIMEGPEKGKDRRMAKLLQKKIEEKITYKYSGFTQVGFHEIPMKLNICLSLVPRDYKTDIDIPSKSYANDLFKQYDFLKETARAYWLQFAEDNKKLFRKICEYRDDIDFSQLIIDPDNITTMYFYPTCAKRIGIFAFYVDADNKPYYKKQTK